MYIDLDRPSTPSFRINPKSFKLSIWGSHFERIVSRNDTSRGQMLRIADACKQILCVFDESYFNSTTQEILMMTIAQVLCSSYYDTTFHHKTFDPLCIIFTLKTRPEAKLCKTVALKLGYRVFVHHRLESHVNFFASLYFDGNISSCFTVDADSTNELAVKMTNDIFVKQLPCIRRYICEEMNSSVQWFGENISEPHCTEPLCLNEYITTQENIGMQLALKSLLHACLL
jgi:hypothetical protein